MSKLLCIVLTLIFAASTIDGNPVINGQNVGRYVKLKNGEKGVVGQDRYPYIVRIEVIEWIKKTKKTFYCGGTIIGTKTVLTAAHCFYGLRKPMATVHSGIVDYQVEQEKGQRLVMKDFVIHENFELERRIKKNLWVKGEHDIAIMWLHEEFRFGLRIKKAEFNFDLNKPANKEGWILGWGFTNENKISPMLQRGLMKVIPRKECKKFNKYAYIPQTFLCLQSGDEKSSMPGEGDSGGPFVIGNIVYGVSSQSFYSESVDSLIHIYIDIAHYKDWINDKLKKGPKN